MEGHTEKGKNTDTHFTNFKESTEIRQSEDGYPPFRDKSLREKSFRDKFIQSKCDILSRT